MFLTTITVQGINFAVNVTPEDGKFHAQFKDEHVEADNLFSLKNALGDMVISTRVEVPFVDPDDGMRGVMRGIHAGNHDILVTWENGTKGRISSHHYVWRAQDDAVIEEVKALVRTAKETHERLREIRSSQGGGTEQAKAVFTDVLGEDLFDYYRHREQATA